MSSFNERYHEQSRAVLFDDWYETLTLPMQERLDIWLDILEIRIFSYGGTSEESRYNMPRSLLWAIYEKNPLAFALRLQAEAVRS